MAMQQELTGRDSTNRLVNILEDWKVNRILLVSGKASYSLCGAKDIFDQVLSPYHVTVFNDFSPNPTFQEAQNGADLCSNHSCDLIIAVGGGSAIDIAKAINVFQAHPDNRLEIIQGDIKPGQQLLPLIAVPTTAGTGSEATHFSVLYLDDKKYSLASPDLLPTLAVINPCFTDKLPPYITACTGFDALCQAIESYWSIGATNDSQTYALQAIKILMSNLPTAVNKPSKDNRDAMMTAANLAGKAINISKTTAPHALSYAITSMYGLPHGHSVALTLGAFFPFHENINEQSLGHSLSADLLYNKMHNLYQLLHADTAEDAKTKWYQLMQQCGLDFNLVDLGIASHTEIQKIVAQVNLERLGNHPVQLTSDQLLEILSSIPAHTDGTIP